MHIYGNFTIERATLKDVPTIAMLDYKMYAERGAELDDKQKSTILQQIMAAVGFDPNARVFVLTIQKHRKRRIVGIAAIKLINDNDKTLALGGELYVEPHYRDTEAVKLLFEAGEAEAKAAKADTIVVDVNRDEMESLLITNGYKKVKMIYAKEVK